MRSWQPYIYLIKETFRHNRYELETFSPKIHSRYMNIFFSRFFLAHTAPLCHAYTAVRVKCLWVRPSYSCICVFPNCVFIVSLYTNIIGASRRPPHLSAGTCCSRTHHPLKGARIKCTTRAAMRSSRCRIEATTAPPRLKVFPSLNCFYFVERIWLPPLLFILLYIYNNF